MKLNFQWQRLKGLSTLELYQVIKAREAVFVVEQQCAYQETDEMDLYAWHLRAFLGNELVAYCRVVDPVIKYPQPSIGRVLTIDKYRKQGIGRSMMNEAIRFTETNYPHSEIKIGAQVQLKAFYESFGFQQVSQPYDDEGIAHIDMLRA